MTNDDIRVRIKHSDWNKTDTGWYRVSVITEEGDAFIYHKSIRKESSARRLRMRVGLKGSINPTYWDKVN